MIHAKYLVGSSILLAALLTYGCNAPESALPPEQQVTEKAEERWQAMIDRDLERAYSFLSPAYRQAVPLDMYRGRIGSAVDWQDAKVESVDCRDEMCKVAVRVDYLHKSSMNRYDVSTLLEEKWILADNKWWYFMKL